MITAYFFNDIVNSPSLYMSRSAIQSIADSCRVGKHHKRSIEIQTAPQIVQEIFYFTFLHIETNKILLEHSLGQFVFHYSMYDIFPTYQESSPALAL